MAGWMLTARMTLALSLVVGVRAARAQDQARPAPEEEDRLGTRYGAVILTRAGEAPLASWDVTFNGKSLVSTEYDELGLWELFEGDDDRDYVIVRRASGGIACPYQFRVIEVGAKGFVRVSDEFGSCLDPKRTALYGNALVLDMPDYIPHPELLSAAEIRRRQQTTVIFTYRGGTVTRREDVRR